MRYCEACKATFQTLRTCPRDRIGVRADLSDPLVGHVLGDRYRVLERIASGGMGQVYRAAHTRIASLFAVKVLYGDLAYEPEMQSRFQREAEAAACLQSRHIVRVVDFSESSEGLLYLAMEHLQGHPLDAAIAQERVIAPARAIAIATQIARGLAHAHERGIVHRDMKPANVMLIREDDEDDVVRLLDFGIARLGESRGLTRAGAVMGTPEYMAPEQFMGAEVDARADLYSLGIVIYEMLTGDVPFVADSIATFAKRHLTEEPVAPSRKGQAAIPPALEAIMLRLLQKSPDQRFSSARDVVAALRAIPVHAASAVVSAVPASVVENEPIAGAVATQQIRAALAVGAPQYNAGDHAGCAAVYRRVAEALLVSGLRPETAVAAGARLEVGVRRAHASASPTQAAWELRYAFDDVIQAVRLTGATPIAVELAAAANIAAPRYAAGELDLVGDYYMAFAARLAADLTRCGGDPSVIAALGVAVADARRAGGGPRGLGVLGRALDALTEGIRATAISLPVVSRRLCAGCLGAEAFGTRIGQAIATGAPAFNRGDVEGCLRLYQQAAREIVTAIGKDPACMEIAALLSQALEEAQALDASGGAWKLRYAFDEILGDLREAATRV